MTPTEKRYKVGIALLGVLFIIAEIPFTHAWLEAQGGLWGIHHHFWHNLFTDPLYQVTVIDFATVALLVFLWMTWDSNRRGHRFRAWLWLPLFLVSPSIGLIGYLLTRRGWEFPVSQDT